MIDENRQVQEDPVDKQEQLKTIILDRQCGAENRLKSIRTMNELTSNMTPPKFKNQATYDNNTSNLFKQLSSDVQMKDSMDLFSTDFKKKESFDRKKEINVRPPKNIMVTPDSNKQDLLATSLPPLKLKNN